MKEIIVESYGKINLGLDILFKREDGYHEINTIMQQIDLSDRLTIRDRERGIVLNCNNAALPLDSTNLAYRAWIKIQEKTGINRGVEIDILKRIPIAAGLAGGSSNAASVLNGLNKLWGLGLKEEELRDIGLEIGADVPYCLVGGTALARGIGEKLIKLKGFKNKDLLIVNPGIGISTTHVYNKLKLKNGPRMDIDKIISSMEREDLKSLGENMINVMEEVVIGEYPIIWEIKEDMLRCGALCSLMSGSGPTVFGFFDNREKLQSCKESMEGKYARGTVLLAKTI